jgi:lipopolysaccharide transport system permease protein
MITTALKLLDLRANVIAARELSALFWRQKELVWEMTRRDILDRYAGQVLGGIWVLANPLLIMAVYVFALAVLFRGRLSERGDVWEYVVYVLSAMAPWIAMAEVLGRAPTAIVVNANLVKQIVFPSQILPIRVAFGALPTLLISLVVVLLVSAITRHGHPMGWLLLPIPILCQLAMSTGFAFLLASLGVFVRDMKDVVGFLLSIGFFLHPIVYAPGVAPRALEAVFGLSPISYLLWCYRDAVFNGGVTNPWIWLTAILLSVGILALGYRIYRVLQPTFGNAL